MYCSQFFFFIGIGVVFLYYVTPEKTKAAISTPIGSALKATPVDPHASWKTYSDTQKGFTVRYPASATIIESKSASEWNHNILTIHVKKVDDSTTFPHSFLADVHIGMSTDSSVISDCAPGTHDEVKMNGTVKITKKTYRTIHASQCVSVEAEALTDTTRGDPDPSDLSESDLETAFLTAVEIAKTFTFD